MVLLVDISPFRFVEPSLDLKMKAIAMTRLKKEEEFDLDSIKTRLKELRNRDHGTQATQVEAVPEVEADDG